MFAVLLALLLVAGCGNQGGSATGNIQAHPAETSLYGTTSPTWKFGWDVPSQVEITERMIRPGHTIHRRYVAYLTQSSTDENLLLRFADLEILDVEGIDSPEEMDSTMVFAAALDILPTFVISPEGYQLGVEDCEDAMWQELQAIRRYSPQLGEEIWMFLEQMVISPELVEIGCVNAMDLWWGWVGLWVELGLASGEAIEGNLLLGEDELLMPSRVEHLGESPYAPGMVRLSFTGTASGDEWKEWVLSQYAAVLPPQEVDDPMVAAMIEAIELQQTFTVSVALFPETLWPVWVCFRVEAVWNIAGDEVTVASQNEYTFRKLDAQVSTGSFRLVPVDATH